MTDDAKKPSVISEETPKGNAGTQLDDASLDNVSGGFVWIRQVINPPPPPPPPTK